MRRGAEQEVIDARGEGERTSGGDSEREREREPLNSVGDKQMDLERRRASVYKSVCVSSVSSSIRILWLSFHSHCSLQLLLAV